MGSSLHLLPLQLLFVVALALQGAARTEAWGKEGHFMACKIAEAYLTENATRAVQELLPPPAGGELAAICSWADEVRFRYRWSSPLHYANTQGVCSFKQSNVNFYNSCCSPCSLPSYYYNPAAFRHKIDSDADTIATVRII
ncbi:hypothetical protein Taro_039282 [Colocasia esculenta]|uniref:Aspergillus nuclease S1 n=1 Tax=Colocasia esculenta TaxID=4460 RepID=A0A843WAA4_COLES|nr:hypothetical protein [Colocasia esculenta]